MIKKTFKILLYLIILFFVGAGAFVFWLYAQPLTDLKIRVFQNFPLPVAMVEGRPLSMEKYMIRYDAAKKVFGLGSPDSDVKQATYNQMIYDKEVEILAQKKGLSVSQKEVAEEYENRLKTSDLDGKKTIGEFLKSYNLTENEYKQEVVMPWLYKQKLQIWFNSETALNQRQYELAKTLAEKINSGEDMGLLARQYSQDDTEKATQGDLGFVEITEVLPEMREALSVMTEGKPQIVASRLGLHIIRLEGRMDNKMHLREIFLAPENFSKWVEQERGKLNVKKLLNF